MSKPLKLAFIGGSIASAVGNAHRVASHMDGSWKLVAGCFSRDKKINVQTGTGWGVNPERLYLDAQAMIDAEKGRVDAIVVLTPTPSHCHWVVKALEAGYSVICEKALAASSSEAELMIQAARENGRLLAVTFNYSGYPMVRELKALIEQGALGKIYSVQIEMPQEGFIRQDGQGNMLCPQPWRLADEKIPVISLDLGVHLHHLVYFLTGESPQSVIADVATNGWFDAVVDDVTCLVRYSNKMRCQMWYSKSALGHRNGLKIRIYGKKASAEWFQMNPELLSIHHVDGRCEIRDRGAESLVTGDLRYNRFKAGHPAGFLEAFANLYADIAEKHVAILQSENKNEAKQNEELKQVYVYGANHALEGLKLLEALHASVQSQRWETV